MNQGTQIMYVPLHVQKACKVESTDGLSVEDARRLSIEAMVKDDRTQFGFVFSQQNGAHFCRLWLRKQWWADPNIPELRTKGNSEYVGDDLLIEWVSVDEKFVTNALYEIEQEKARLLKMMGF